MKLLYLATTDFPRRVANRVQVMKMADAFAGQCDEVTLSVGVLHQTEERVRAYYDLKHPFSIHQIGDRGIRPRSLFMMPGLIRCVRSVRPGVIYVREEYPALTIAALGWPFVYEMLDYQRCFARIYKLIVARSLMTVVISHGLKERAVAAGLPADKLLVLPDGVDLDAFTVDLDQLQARPRVGLQTPHTIALYSGRFSPWKGVDTIIEAASYFDDGILAVLIGGFEGEADRLQESIDRRGVGGRVLVLGHVPHTEIPLYLQSADVVVIPNSARSEVGAHFTSPLKLFEYMASRRPIVASRLPALCEIVDESCAYLVEPDNPQDLARGINQAVASRDAGARARRAADRVREFSWDARVRAILTQVGQRLYVHPTARGVGAR